MMFDTPTVPKHAIIDSWCASVNGHLRTIHVRPGIPADIVHHAILAIARCAPVSYEWVFKGIAPSFNIHVFAQHFDEAVDTLKGFGLYPPDDLFRTPADAAKHHLANVPEFDPEDEPDLTDPEVVKVVKEYEAETEGTPLNPDSSVPIEGMGEQTPSGEWRGLTMNQLMELAEFEPHYGKATVPPDTEMEIVSWKRRDSDSSFAKTHKVWRHKGFMYMCTSPSDQDARELSIAGVVDWLCQEKLLKDNDYAIDDATVLQKLGFQIDTERSETNEDGTYGQVVWTKGEVEITKSLEGKFVYYELNDPKKPFTINASSFQTIRNALKGSQ